MQTGKDQVGQSQVDVTLRGKSSLADRLMLPVQGKPQSIAAAALAAAKAAASGTGHGQVSVTETRRFAGKDVQVKMPRMPPCPRSGSICILHIAYREIRHARPTGLCKAAVLCRGLCQVIMATLLKWYLCNPLTKAILCLSR